MYNFEADKFIGNADRYIKDKGGEMNDFHEKLNDKLWDFEMFLYKIGKNCFKLANLSQEETNELEGRLENIRHMIAIEQHAFQESVSKRKPARLEKVS